MRILPRTCEVIQGLDFLLGFDFPRWVVTTDLRILLKQVIAKDKFGSSGRFSILDSTTLVKQDQPTQLRRHLPDLDMTGW